MSRNGAQRRGRFETAAWRLPRPRRFERGNGDDGDRDVPRQQVPSRGRRLVALGRRAAGVRGRLGQRGSAIRAMSGPLAHGAGVALGAACHPRLGRGLPAVTLGEVPQRHRQREDRGARPGEELEHGPTMQDASSECQDVGTYKGSGRLCSGRLLPGTEETARGNRGGSGEDGVNGSQHEKRRNEGRTEKTPSYRYEGCFAR
jgi:hypothetical protein